MALAILCPRGLIGLVWETGLGRPQTTSMLRVEFGVVSVYHAALSKMLGAGQALVHEIHRWPLRRDPPQSRRPVHHRKCTNASVTCGRIYDNGVFLASRAG